MRKTLSSLLLFTLLSSMAYAQLNPAKLKKSLVKIMVTQDGKLSVCSGFIWKKPNQVVTSLHAMKPNGDVKIVYMDKVIRKASIAKTHAESDLVLLEVEGEIPSEVVPLQEYDDKSIPFGEMIVALGYNNGAKGSSTRTLKKGFADPEVLASLVPPKDRKQLEKSGVPSINLSIIYLDGSLLPGYSGSPVVDKDGNLVGIGDGGLEQGASNVSWVIPAKYLSELEKSTTNQLPEGLVKATQSFSAEVEIEVDKEIETMDDLAAIDQKYTSFSYGEFDFYETKIRSFEDMYQTSIDPENMEYFLDDYREYNVEIAYQDFKFDIYEDANNGIVISVPYGADISVNEQDGTLEVDTKGQGYTYLAYSAEKGDYSGQDMDDIIDEVIKALSDDFYESHGVSLIEDKEVTYYIDVDDTHKIAYVALDSDGAFTGENGYEYGATTYMTILLNENQLFLSMAFGILPLETFQSVVDAGGIDCIRNYQSGVETCDFLSNLLQVFCSAHLTTFANRKVVRH